MPSPREQPFEPDPPPGTDALLAELYDELRRLAAQCFLGQAESHTLQPTALLHEAYLKLAAHGDAWNDETHFRAVAATAMRQILLNHAEKRNTLKRGGGRKPDVLRDDAATTPPAEDVLDLAVALEELGTSDARKAAVAEMRLFGGLTMPQISTRVGRSLTTVEDDWRTARAWLAARLEGAA